MYGVCHIDVGDLLWPKRKVCGERINSGEKGFFEPPLVKKLASTKFQGGTVDNSPTRRLRKHKMSDRRVFRTILGEADPHTEFSSRGPPPLKDHRPKFRKTSGRARGSCGTIFNQPPCRGRECPTEARKNTVMFLSQPPKV